MTSGFSKARFSLSGMLRNRNTLLIIYLLSALIVSAQLLITTQTHPKEGWPTLYNNYVIFRMSFSHLIHGVDLYSAHPAAYYDLYKYSPAFAVLMAPFSLLPDYLGLPLWNLLNAFVLLLGIRHSGLAGAYRQNLLLLFLLPELIISMQNAQSNALVAGLMLLALGFMQRQNMPYATLLLALGTMIKIFPAACFLLLLLFPGFVKSVLWSILWFFLLFLLPLPFSGPENFSQVYLGWFELLRTDHAASSGLSIFSWLDVWFGFKPDKNILLLGSAVLLIICFIRPVIFTRRTLAPAAYLCMLMVWMVIFNHKAESPTFIIAMTGIGLWYFTQPAHPAKKLLLFLALIFVSLSPTDLFPPTWRDGWIRQGVWKAFPCIIAWFWICFELLFRTGRDEPQYSDSGSGVLPESNG